MRKINVKNSSHNVWIWVIVAIAAFIFLSGGFSSGRMGMMGYGYGMMGSFGLITWLLVIVVLVLLIVWLLKQVQTPRR